jgi:DNA (cytosine-5)-methyltransferase 1
MLARAVAGEIVKAMRLRPSTPKEIVVLGDPKLLSMTLAQAAQYYGVPTSVIAKRDRNYAKEETDARRAA